MGRSIPELCLHDRWMSTTQQRGDLATKHVFNHMYNDISSWLQTKDFGSVRMPTEFAEHHLYSTRDYSTTMTGIKEALEESGKLKPGETSANFMVLT